MKKIIVAILLVALLAPGALAQTAPEANDDWAVWHRQLCAAVCQWL